MVRKNTLPPTQCNHSKKKQPLNTATELTRRIKANIRKLYSYEENNITITDCIFITNLCVWTDSSRQLNRLCWRKNLCQLFT